MDGSPRVVSGYGRLLVPKLSFRNFEGVLESGGVVPHVEGYDPEFLGVHFGERGYILEREGVCFRERGLYPRLNQSEDERSQTRSGNESTCCASRAWMASTSSMSLTWAACIVREVIDILLRFQDGREIPEDLLDGAVMKLELAYRELVGLDIVGGLCLEQQQACESVRVAVANLRDIGDRNYAQCRR